MSRSKGRSGWVFWVAVSAFCWGCAPGVVGENEQDSGAAPLPDASVDGGAQPDAGLIPDAGDGTDSGVTDSGVPDAGEPFDAGAELDSGVDPDAGDVQPEPDAGTLTTDAGPDLDPDAGPVDAGPGDEPDAGPFDAGIADAGPGYPLVARAYFNVPGENGERDRTIENLVAGLCDATPAGSVIRMAMFSWTSPVVSDALLRAKQRGVLVSVVVDDDAGGANAASAPLQSLQAAGLVSFVRCRGTGALATATSCVAARAGGIQHNKFFTFSTTALNGQTLKRVVVVSSQNWTFTQNNLWNNAVLLAGDVPLYDGYRLYFDDLRTQARTTDYYVTPHGYVKSGLTGTTAYFFPRADSLGGVSAEASTDTVAGRLAYLSQGAGCFAHVAQNHLTDARLTVVAELQRIAALPCEVKVIYGTMEPQALAALRATPNVTLKRYEDNDATNLGGRQVTVHSKYTVLHGTYNGTPNRTVVLTGSHNWSGASLRLNDENMIKVEEPAVSQAFEQNFAAMWARAKCTNPTTGTCP